MAQRGLLVERKSICAGLDCGRLPSGVGRQASQRGRWVARHHSSLLRHGVTAVAQNEAAFSPSLFWGRPWWGPTASVCGIAASLATLPNASRHASSR